jgi:hypothetical protein
MRNSHGFVLRVGTLAVLCMTGDPVHAQVARDPAYEARARSYLASLVYTRDAVGRWLQGHAAHGESYHEVLGWVHNPRTIQHGIDKSSATYGYDSDGARRQMAYQADRCRINTYGNSFTSCEQVNDGETWQEMLAAHLCEPIRNFGIGGYSVYQSYRRMLLEEPRTPAKYLRMSWGPRSVCKVRGLQNRSGVKIRIVWAMWPRCAATRKSRLWAS